MKELTKVIKKNLSFKELPKDIKEAIVDNEANAMIINFDEGVYTKRTALIDAKKHYEDCKKSKPDTFDQIGRIEQQNLINEMMDNT